jgi:membrane associated rhomboid family serine protease
MARLPWVIRILALTMVLAHVLRFALAPNAVTLAGLPGGLGLSPEWNARLLDLFAVIPSRYEAENEFAYASPLQAALPLLGHVFLHGGWLHLAMNLFMFLQVGGLVANRLELKEPGGVRFLALFFGSGIGGALLYIAINQGQFAPALGASGAICGLFGAYLLAMRGHWRDAIRDPEVQQAAFWFLFINVGLAAVARVTGFLPIAWEAHLGGFLAGGLLYPLLAPQFRLTPWR